jgi:hypothetical protein
VFFDFVAQGERGAGVAGLGVVELGAERGEGAGAAGRGERVEPHVRVRSRGDVAAGGEGFADEGAGLVAGAGVVPVQGAGQDGLGVAGGHPDGVGDQLGLGLQPHLPGLCWLSGIFAGTALAAACAASSLARAEHLVVMVVLVPGGGAAQRG